MNRIRIYTINEICELEKNPNIECILNRSQIKYKNKFKLWAVKEKINHPEKTAREIFEEAGFNMNILDSRTPQKRICTWIEKYYKFGEGYFINDNKYSYKANECEKDTKYFLLRVHNGDYKLFPIERDKNEKINC